MPPHTRVLLIEHNRLLRDAITLLLAAQPDVALVGAVASGEAALRESHAKNAQVVLVDLGLKDDDSARVVRELKRTAPDVRIIAMDLFPVHEDVVELVKAGVSGLDRKSTRLNSSHGYISYAVFCLKKKKHRARPHHRHE